MLDELLVGLIVAAALGVTGRFIYKSLSGENSGCATCGTDCPTCGCESDATFRIDPPPPKPADENSSEKSRQ